MTVIVKPTTNSQVFKRLYTRKTNTFKELRLKNDLCRDYCAFFDIDPRKAEVGENEYKRFNFDLRNAVPLKHAQVILSLYTKHINETELKLKQQILNQDDIANTPGLERVKRKQWNIFKSKNDDIGNIHLAFNCIYQLSKKTAKENNNLPYKSNRLFDQIYGYMVWSCQNKALFKHRITTVLLVIFACILYNYRTSVVSSEDPLICNITINDEYTYEKHMIIWREREKDIKQQLLWLKREAIDDNKNNQQLISVLETKLAKVENDLATSRNKKESYKERLAYLNERLNELESIKDQIAPYVYKQAYFALMLGDTEKAYQLYQLFNDESELTIQRVAKANYEQGLIDMSQLAYQRALSRFERAVNLQPNSIQYLYKAGHLAYTLNNFNKAISYYEQALEHSDIKHNHNRQQIVQIYSELGLAWKTLGKFQKATGYLENGLKYANQYLDKDHPQIANLWQGLGDVNQELGDQIAALDYFEGSLKSNIRLNGAKDINVAVAWHSIGLAWHDLGSTEKAHKYSHKSISIFENALSTQLNKLSDHHPEIILYRNKLGLAWIVMGEPYKAIDYIEKSLSGNIKLFGSKHLSVARNWNNLGSAWEAAGKYTKAKSSYEKSYEAFKNQLSNKHPATQNVFASLQRMKKNKNI